MKNNQPVTNVEYILKDSDSIVSKTDLKGVITYINSDFTRISGFTENELIGQSHNIVRHPDMPVEAFADLWASMKANRPWTGLVKNRSKNGDFYWVLANATPIYEKGACVGYMSVRSKPTRDQVALATAVYTQFLKGQAGGLQIKDGNVVKASILNTLNLFKHASLKFRIVSVLAILSLLFLGLGGIVLFGMSKSNEGLRMVYEERTIPMEQISNIQKLLLTNRLRIEASLIKPTTEVIQLNTADVDRNIEEITKTWAAYSATKLSPQEKGLADKFAADRTQFVTEGLKPAVAALRSNEIKRAESIELEKIGPLYEAVGNDIKQLMQFQLDGADHEYNDSVASSKILQTQTIIIFVIGELLAFWAFLTLVLGVLKPMKKITSLVENVSQGNYENEIIVKRQDEMGNLMDALKAMQITLGFKAADEGRIASENLRIRIGLDNVSTGVTIADTDRTLIYINKAAVSLMKAVENDFRKELPNFDASKLLGSSIDTFHLNPSHQNAMMENLISTHRTQILVGGHTFALAASPVVNTGGARLGTVLEWNHRTVEVAIEKEVATIVEAAVRGDFKQRIEMTGKEAFFKQLGLGINQLMETSDRGLQEVVRMLDSLARGDLTDCISNEYHGTFGQLKNDANTTSDRLKDIIGQIKEATDTINTAAKEIATGNNDLSHRTEEQASSLQETASSMDKLTTKVKQNAEFAMLADQLAHTASSVAVKGGAVVNEVVGTMNSINESSHKIVDIISVIDGIAFQTNILALNAAVEAARAGEQGRGFAVVATEVRNLAQRSAAAAKEIKILIGNSVKQVEIGTKLVDDAGKTMEEIVIAVKNVTDIMDQIRTASAEQSSGIEQVNQAITQMDEVTQQNAALVEEASAAAESLEIESQNLTRSVSVFKIVHVQQTAISSAHRVAAKPAVRRAPPASTNSTASTSKPKAVPSKLPMKGGEEWEEFEAVN